LLLTIDGMAQRYGLLPTEVMQRATTYDMIIFYNSNLIKVREEKKAKGESVADTYSQNSIEQMYQDFKERKNGNESK